MTVHSYTCTQTFLQLFLSTYLSTYTPKVIENSHTYKCIPADLMNKGRKRKGRGVTVALYYIVYILVRAHKETGELICK